MNFDMVSHLLIKELFPKWSDAKIMTMTWIGQGLWDLYISAPDN